MDMNVSPDIEAYFCYLLVLALGLATAWAQVSRRLGNLPGKWIMANTWFLLAAYTFVPVLLFWLLDRTNATHDTSLFAAVLVGVGYQQILSGNIGSIKAPGTVSAFWQPFAAWADGIAALIRQRVAINDAQFDEKFLASVAADPARLESLRQVVMVHAKDANAVLSSLNTIANDKRALGDAGVLAKQATLLYRTLKQVSPQQFEYLLYRNRIIPMRWYLWYAREWRSKVTALAVAVALIVAVVSLARYELSQPEVLASYYVWRLRKDNGTDSDRYRARMQLTQYLNDESTLRASFAPRVYPLLIGLLRIPNLSGKTADAVLALLIETDAKAAGQNPDPWPQLIQALRTDNSDIRERVQKTLVYLAAQRQYKTTKKLSEWHSDPKNTASDIDAIVKAWNGVVH